MEIKDDLNGSYSIRNSFAQKERFRYYYAHALSMAGFAPSIQTSRCAGIRCDNIIAGSIRSSRNILLADYDTPKTRFLPYIHGTGGVLSLISILLCAALIGGGVFLLTSALSLPIVIGEVLYFAIMVMLNMAVPNKNNSVCTDSCVLAFSELLSSLRDFSVAGVLLDNSDILPLGRHMFLREYADILAAKTLIFIGLCGRGDTICIEYTAKAREQAQILANKLGGAALLKMRSLHGYAALRISSAYKTRAGYIVSDIKTVRDDRLDSHALNSVVDAVKKLFI